MSKKILVADDERWMREMVRDKLESAGYSVETVDDGDKAVEAYRAAAGSEDAFSLILLDIEMPGRTGLEVLRAIRETELGREGSYVPVIMVTACEEPWMKAFKTGCDDYILKPYEAEDLIIKVEQALRERELMSDMLKSKGKG
jgi:CheY-like chemotaxis protein